MNYRMKLMGMAATAALLAGADGRLGCRHRGHPLVDLEGRIRRGVRVRQGARRRRPGPLGRQRHRARRDRPRHRDAARARRRPARRRAVQPRPPVRGTDRRRPSARPHRPRHRGQVGRGHPAEADPGGLPGRRPLVVRAGQHPLELLGLVLQARLREGRPARADQPRGLRRGRAEAPGSRHHPVRHRRRRQWLADPAPLPGHGDRGARRREPRQDVHRQERASWPAAPRCRACSRSSAR